MIKKTALVLGLLAMAGTFQTAAAKSLEDVLKEKGVITEEDYKSVVKSGPVKYKLGEGFNFTSADEKFSGSIGANYQIRYTLMDLDDANDTATTKSQNSSTFETKRVKVYFTGYAFSKDISYKLQLNFANLRGGKTSNNGLLEETYINYRLFDELQFRFGQDKVQFGRQSLLSATVLQLVDQSIVTQAFFPTYDTGLNVHGKVAKGLLTYSVAVTGGTGQNTPRLTSDNAFSARLTVNPFGELKNFEADLDHSEKPAMSIGSSFYRNTLSFTELTNGVDTGNSLGFTKGKTGWYGLGNSVSPTAKKFAAGEDLDFNTFGIDTAFKWQGLSAQGEYMYGEANSQQNSKLLIAKGFYGQVGYCVIPKKVELAYRYSYLDPNNDVGNDHWVENTAGVSWYINKHFLKLQADYTNVHKQAAIASTKGAKSTDDKQIRLQAQIMF